MEGKEPTLKDKLLQKELAAHHMRLEPQVVAQNQTKSGNKNSGRQVLPNTPTNNQTGVTRMSPTEQTTTTTTATPTATAAPTPHVADRVEAALLNLIDELQPDPMWKQSVKIGALALGAFTISVASGLVVYKLTSPGSSAPAALVKPLPKM